ncbi:hypothetical protein crov277 [Cafeteria roenbergensis virus]|uniref:RING-type domain-containing protein n=1 Tax=Cafeteria roenbergensis virus (strain BV-PW1) TaxID=693272 RepID=E3T547_CROVB|nr:hypothetical protein crov277 [Cafeteria roenbergensis virus BV-PW1]ADO67310.1 hypothetical protein crov277 [Cafeteria roenbergensis virus BV-PW1]
MAKIKGNLKEIKWVTTWQYKCINRDCTICRESIESIESTKEIVSIGSCGHGFHTNCLNKWFTHNNNSTKCPVCIKNWVES